MLVVGRLRQVVPSSKEGDSSMKQVVAFVIALAGLSAFGQALAADSPTAMDVQQMIAGADALDDAFVAAFNRGDAEALSQLYWNNRETSMFPPDTLEMRGYRAIQEGFAKMMSEFKGAKLELTERHQRPAADIVVGWGKWRLTMAGPDGKPTEMIGRYTDVKMMRDGKWVYYIDHASVPLPPAPPSPPPPPAPGR
jgi:ketosteroid isomerase-like protein